jgi:hypothetical protein
MNATSTNNGRNNLIVTIITSLIGSSLLAFIGTSLYSTINQPNIFLNILFNIDSTSRNASIDYYEVLAKNDGLADASNLTLSMFFVGNVLDAKPIIYNLKPYVTHTTNITTYSNHPIATKSTLINNSISGNNTLYDNTLSLVTATIKHLAKNELIIIGVWLKANKEQSYYISASYDHGYNHQQYINTKDINSGIFPDVRIAHSFISADFRIILFAGIAATFSFAVALVLRFRLNVTNTLQKYPIPILASILILVIIENQALLIPILKDKPFLVFPSNLSCKLYPSDDMRCKEGDISLNTAIFNIQFLFILVLFARSIVSYFFVILTILSKSGVKFSELSTNLWLYKRESEPRLRHYIGIRFSSKMLFWSFLIMGFPIEFSIMAFFGQYLIFYLSPFILFVIVLMIDISRMSFLAIYIPERFKKKTDAAYYELNLRKKYFLISIPFVLFIVIVMILMQLYLPEIFSFNEHKLI